MSLSHYPRTCPILCSTAKYPQGLRQPSISHKIGHPCGPLRGCMQERGGAGRYPLWCTRPLPFLCRFQFTPQRLIHPPPLLCSRRRLFSLGPLDPGCSAVAQAAERDTVLLGVWPALGLQPESGSRHLDRPHTPLEETQSPASSVHAQGASCNPRGTVNG